MSERDDSSPFAVLNDPDPLSPDPNLADLVKFANAFGLELHVILTLPGQVIGGLLVSGKTHFESMAASLLSGRDESNEDSVAGSMATLLRHYGDPYTDFGAESKVQDDDPEDMVRPPLPDVAFIHLADAYLVSTEGLAPIGRWRGRLSEIVGWTLGLLTVDEPDD